MMLRAVPDRSLDEILSGVSRSFYLSLAILPRAIRSQLSVAYLVARAADTIADTRVVRAERRLELLDGLRDALSDERQIVPLCAEVRREVGAPDAASGGASPSERILLDRLGDCLRTLAAFEPGDRGRTQKVLGTLIQGMERDLQRFPDEQRLVALETMAELDEHTYLAAGCVGEYWTLISATHVPSVKRLSRPDFVARGVRLGKALQLVNVIRDAAADLAQGRCYVPRDLLSRHGLTPEDLRDPSARRRARPALDELHVWALAHVDASFPYVLAIPRREARLRLAALWPLWIGLATLQRLRTVDDPLDPTAAVKIDRGDVYRILVESTAAVASDTLLTRLHQRRRRQAS
jgi:farnesyl-diphosphate farnesyltransferase